MNDDRLGEMDNPKEALNEQDYLEGELGLLLHPKCPIIRPFGTVYQKKCIVNGVDCSELKP